MATLRHTLIQTHIFALMFIHSYTQIHALCRHISTGMETHACRLSLPVAHTYCLSHKPTHTYSLPDTHVHAHKYCLFQADAFTYMLSLADTHTYILYSTDQSSPPRALWALYPLLALPTSFLLPCP